MNETALSRRAAFKEAVLEGIIETQLIVFDTSNRVRRLRTRLGVLAAAAVFTFFAGVLPAFATTGTTSASGGGCTASATNTLLTFTAYAGDFLIGLGAGAFILIVSLGACFIIFGVTPKRVHKGMELIKQAVIGLAFLAAGGIIRFIVVDLLFKRPATSFSTTC